MRACGRQRPAPASQLEGHSHNGRSLNALCSRLYAPVAQRPPPRRLRVLEGWTQAQ